MGIAIVLYFILGMTTGLLAGLLGLGGGIIAVPVLLGIFQWQDFSSELSMHLAVGTSLAAMVMTTSASTRVHHQRGNVVWRLWKLAAPGILLGTVIGTTLVEVLPMGSLKQIFAGVSLLVATRLILFPREKENVSKKLPGVIVMSLVGCLIGVLAGLLGIGGATLAIPIFLSLGMNMRTATATAAACALPAAICGALLVMRHGSASAELLPPHSVGFVYWPAALVIGVGSMLTAPIGAYVSHKVSVERLKRIFGLVLMIVSAKMVI